VSSGSATYGEDVTIYTMSSDPECKNQGPGTACVVFEKNSAPVQIISVRILPDLTYEGDETFFLEIIRPVHLGNRGFPYTLKVTIVDASKRKRMF